MGRCLPDSILLLLYSEWGGTEFPCGIYAVAGTLAAGRGKDASQPGFHAHSTMCSHLRDVSAKRSLQKEAKQLSLFDLGTSPDSLSLARNP